MVSLRLSDNSSIESCYSSAGNLQGSAGHCAPAERGWLPRMSIQCSTIHLETTAKDVTQLVTKSPISTHGYRHIAHVRSSSFGYTCWERKPHNFLPIKCLRKSCKTVAQSVCGAAQKTWVHTTTRVYPYILPGAHKSANPSIQVPRIYSCSCGPRFVPSSTSTYVLQLHHLYRR